MSDTQLFADALEKRPHEREAFLDGSCTDGSQRERVTALLRAHARAEVVLSVPLGPRGRAEEEVGASIAGYKLVEKIGEGGCGVVWQAQQERPVRRRVALKLIKLGMDTREVLARFDAERQALAMMEHPNIARVFEAGATEGGRPFFVMEMVRGVTITRYCDQQHLPVADRLHLFVQACRAIQHAHEKGVIHRDVKPSNILVVHENDEARVKVIDFGIAKAIQGRLTDYTLCTTTEQFIGTPAYMSPEQATGNARDLTTSTDIYSLGALLYELLTGCTPFELETLTTGGVAEMRRIIREVDPPRPSRRLTRPTAERQADIAARRGLRKRQLQVLLGGDLDQIAMKAIEKEPVHRYESVQALAEDILHYLHREPVRARRRNASYVVWKFISRRRVALLAGGALLGAFTLGHLASASRAQRAEREKTEMLAAQAHQMSGFYAVGVNPYGAAFAGESVWVCNQGADSVSRLRARDGALLGTYAVGSLPFAVLAVGPHVWVTNQGSHTVTKLRAGTGQVVGTYPCGNGPTGIGFDGTHVWIGNVGVNTVTKIRESTGEIVGTFPCLSARGVAFDGRHIWVCNHSAGTVTRYEPATGAALGTYPADAGAYAILFDGTSLWTANIFADTVTKLDPATGATVGTYRVGAYPRGLAFDGKHLWVANANSNNVTRLDARTGALVATYPAGLGPFGIAWDGARVWVVNQKSSSVKKF